MTNIIKHLGWIIEAELWSHQEFASWADGLIERLDMPPVWLLELSSCRSLEECKDVVSSEQLSEPPQAVCVDSDSKELALIGMLTLRFRRGEISSKTLNREVLGVLDAYQPPFLAVDDIELVASEGSVLESRSHAGILEQAEMLARHIENGVLELGSSG